MSEGSEKSVPYQIRPTSISFGGGPPQLVVYLEHLPEALAYVLDKQIVSIEVDTHARQTSPLQIDFGFLNGLPHLTGFECRMNIAKKSDLGPVHQLKKLKQLAWPARTSPTVDLSQFPELEHLSIRHQPTTSGWEKLTKLKMLRLSVTADRNLRFLAHLEALSWLEVADSAIESMAGIEHLDHLEKINIIMAPKLIDISGTAKCKNLEWLSVEKAKQLTDYSTLAESKSIETLKLLTPVDSVEFVPRMKSLKSFFCHAINSNDLSPLLQAKSLRQLDFYPEKRSYSHTLADLKQSLGI